MKKRIGNSFNLVSGDFSGNWLDNDFGALVSRSKTHLIRVDCPDCDGSVVMSRAGLLTTPVHNIECPECGAKFEVKNSSPAKIRRRLEEFLRQHPGDAVALAAALGCRLTD